MTYNTAGSSPNYLPGDVANGYTLTVNGQWVPVNQAQAKNQGVFTALALVGGFLFPVGLHRYYLGNWQLGLVFTIGYVFALLTVLIFVGFFIWFGLFIWSIVNACRAATLVAQANRTRISV